MISSTRGELMNQIIIIGEVIKLNRSEAFLQVEIKTKDYRKETITISIKVENGYQETMVDVLSKLPFIAVKCGLKLNRNKIEFIAEKMSVLKLSEEESKDS